MFYLGAFIDNVERVFRGTATWAMLGNYLWYATPQNIYYVLPLAVLMGALVTIGVLTKNSELVVMKACGISLYRVAMPMLAGALLVGGVLFGLEESVLGPSNRQAEALRHVMRGGSLDTFDVLRRGWMVGSRGEIYNYSYFDPGAQRLQGLSIFRFDPGMQRIEQRTFAEVATFAGAGEDGDQWRMERGWTRQFDERGDVQSLQSFDSTQAAIEPVSYFGTEQPDSTFMSYTQLRRYVAQLEASGFDVSGLQVALARKISFPFVAVVMTLIAVPFAVTTGRRGAMYGIGVGIVLAITYWVTISVFAAFGTAGLMAPMLAAWAPNLLFGAGAGYLLLTVQT
jgi:LPS export ABC transporter permease LptG